jgi:hypothetical protein
LNNTEIIKDKTTVIDNGKMLKWLGENATKYPRKEATVIDNAMATQGYSVKNSADVILQGSANGTCQVVFYPFTGKLGS